MPQFLIETSCFDLVVINAIIETSKEPQSFLNRKGPSEAARPFFEFLYYGATGVGIPNLLALGVTMPGIGQGTGGLLLPPLQRKTFHNLLRIFDPTDTSTQIRVSHLAHGAPLKVPPESTGYSHRDTGWCLNLNGQSPAFINTLLEDRAYQGDPVNLQIYGNYVQSVRTQNYERHIFVDNVEELSRIRTLYDPLGGFDSQRYVQRSRSAPRTVTQYKKPKKSKESERNN